MRSAESSSTSVALLAKELAFDVFQFPFWWYTTGVKRILRYWVEEMRLRAARLALGIWARNLFTPMYGDYTKSGRFISFFLRLVVLTWRFIEMAVWTVVITALSLIWFALPPVLIYAIIRQFS